MSSDDHTTSGSNTVGDEVTTLSFLKSELMGSQEGDDDMTIDESSDDEQMFTLLQSDEDAASAKAQQEMGPVLQLIKDSL